MRLVLQNALETLRAHETDLRRLGVAHAAVFGSVARSEARAESDIDVLVELDENRPMGIFEYARPISIPAAFGFSNGRSPRHIPFRFPFLALREFELAADCGLA